MYGKTMTKEQKAKISIGVKNSIVKHHKYLKKYSEKIIEMKHGKHLQLHRKSYEYILIRYGKKGIDDYIRWFAQKHGGLL